MKLFSASIEIAVLKTICSGGKVGDWLLGVADPYLFHTEAGMQTIGRIRKILSTASSVPQWSAILHDPVLSASVAESTCQIQGRENTHNRRQKMQFSYCVPMPPCVNLQAWRPRLRRIWRRIL